MVLCGCDTFADLYKLTNYLFTLCTREGVEWDVGENGNGRRRSHRHLVASTIPQPEIANMGNKRNEVNATFKCVAVCVLCVEDRFVLEKH